jgi:hypothetical protein
VLSESAYTASTVRTAFARRAAPLVALASLLFIALAIAVAWIAFQAAREIGDWIGVLVGGYVVSYTFIGCILAGYALHLYRTPVTGALPAAVAVRDRFLRWTAYGCAIELSVFALAALWPLLVSPWASNRIEFSTSIFVFLSVNVLVLLVAAGLARLMRWGAIETSLALVCYTLAWLVMITPMPEPRNECPSILSPLVGCPVPLWPYLMFVVTGVFALLFPITVFRRNWQVFRRGWW